MCLKKWDFEKENINSFTLLRGREREISALVGVFEHYELYTLQLSHVENKYTEPRSNAMLNHIVMLNKTFSNVLKKWDFEKENINSFTLLRGRERFLL